MSTQNQPEIDITGVSPGRPIEDDEAVVMQQQNHKLLQVKKNSTSDAGRSSKDAKASHRSRYKSDNAMLIAESGRGSRGSRREDAESHEMRASAKN